MSMTENPYDESYPPSVLHPAPPAATQATAGIPGAWLPEGSAPPANITALKAGGYTASPTTPWTEGQYVQTATTGTGGRGYWDGTAWQTGAAPAP